MLCCLSFYIHVDANNLVSSRKRLTFYQDSYNRIIESKDLEMQLSCSNNFYKHYEREKHINIELAQLNFLVNLNYATAQFKLGNIEKTWQYLDTCLSQIDQPDYKNLATEVYCKIGEMLGEVDAATSILLFQKAMSLARETIPQDKAMVYRCLKEIINIYVNTALDENILQNSDLAAKEHSILADKILINKNIHIYETDAATSIYRTASESLMWLGEDSLASEYVRKLQSNSNNYSDKILTEGFAEMLYGVDAYIKGNREKSIEHFTLSIKEIGEKDSYLNLNLEMSYAYLGFLYIETGEYDLAIDNMEKSIKCLTNANYKTIDDTFRLIDYNELYDANHAFNILLCLERLQSYYEIALAEEFSQERLQQFYQLSEYTRLFIKTWFLNASGEDVLVQAAKLLRECNETVIDVMFTYSNEDNTLTDKTFMLATEPGAFYLRYLIHLKDIDNNNNSSTTEKELALLKEINQLTVSLINTPKELSNENYLNQSIALIRAKTLLNKQQETHLNLIENTSVLKDIKLGIDENTLIAKYFISDENLYIIACTSDQQKTVKVPLTHYRSKLKQIQKTLKTGSENIKAQQYFYSKLIDPIAPLLEGKTEFHILNDENLANLPFEVLCNDQEHLLINDINVKYYYSAQGIGEIAPTTEKIQSVVAFAPISFETTQIGDELHLSYQNDENILDDLTHSKEEVTKIGQLCSIYNLDSKVHLGKTATKSNFKTLASNADILHIATHGIGSGRYDKGLIFAGNTYNDQVMIASELYSMNVNSDLVVLSACKTAVGQVAEGEGVMALPRSFIYAGVPNVIAAMWNVDDRKTTEFITAFYDNLFQHRYSYAEALRATKLNCINEGWLPLDWAAFILIGK